MLSIWLKRTVVYPISHSKATTTWPPPAYTSHMTPGGIITGMYQAIILRQPINYHLITIMDIWQ